MNENSDLLVKKYLELGCLNENAFVRDAILLKNYNNPFIINFIKKFIDKAEKKIEEEKKNHQSNINPIITQEQIIALEMEAERDEKGRFKLPENLIQIEKQAKKLYGEIMFLYQNIVFECLGNLNNLDTITFRDVLDRIDDGEFFNFYYLTKNLEVIFFDEAQIYHLKSIGSYKSKKNVAFKHNDFKHKTIKTSNPKYPTVQIICEFMLSFNGKRILNIT